MKEVTNEEFMEYVSLSEEERRSRFFSLSSIVQRNGGKECPYARHHSYQIKLM